MSKNEIGPKLNGREALYNCFDEGARPSANDFKNLIFSTINKLDDGISKSFEHGLKLSPEGKNVHDLEAAISLYERIDSMVPSWTFSLKGEKDSKSLCISKGNSDEILLTLTSDGKIGVLESAPREALDIKGKLRARGRVGSYVEKEFKPANNEWHTILKIPNGGCYMFEVSAFAYGKENAGKYASIHAIASNAYSGKRGRIQCSRDFYAWRWWNRLKLRWVGSPFDYELQIKTCSDYGREGQIQYNITQLGREIVYKRDQNKPVKTIKNYPEK